MADYPLYLPAGWEVAKVQSPLRGRRVASPSVKCSRCDPRPRGSRKAISGPERRSEVRTDLYWGIVGGCTKEKGDEFRGTGSYPRPGGTTPRPRPVSPDPDRTPALAAEKVKSYQIAEDGYFIPRLPSPNSCPTHEELSELRDLLHEFRDQFNDGTRPLSATYLLKTRLDTDNPPPVSFPPRRLSPAMREVMRSAVAELGVKGITEPGEGQ